MNLSESMHKGILVWGRRTLRRAKNARDSMTTDEIEIVRDALIEYLAKSGYEARKIYQEGVQMDGCISPINIWVEPDSTLVCGDWFKISICDPDSFDKLIEDITKYHTWNPDQKAWGSKICVKPIPRLGLIGRHKQN